MGFVFEAVMSLRYRRPASVALLLIALMMVPMPGGSAILPSDDQVPCTAPGLCPDIIVDEQALASSWEVLNRTFSTGHCAVQEGATPPGTQRLLRFETATANVGTGALHVGNPNDNQQWFEWGACHGHWHFKDYAEYRLWDPDTYAEWDLLRTLLPLLTADEVFEMFPHLADGFEAGRKQAFCFIDLRSGYLPLVPVLASPTSVYRSCGNNQGISVGWADVYSRFLDGQWIVITDVASGEYVLEVEANPTRLVQELSYANNRAAVTVNI